MYATVRITTLVRSIVSKFWKSWLDHESLQTGHFGPILFREECIFRKKIGLSDTIFMHTKISKMRPDASRWSIVHEFKMKKINYVP
jgi:acyl-CoA thioesterase FadM